MERNPAEDPPQKKARLDRDGQPRLPLQQEHQSTAIPTGSFHLGVSSLLNPSTSGAAGSSNFDSSPYNTIFDQRVIRRPTLPAALHTSSSTFAPYPAVQRPGSHLSVPTAGSSAFAAYPAVQTPGGLPSIFLHPPLNPSVPTLLYRPDQISYPLAGIFSAPPTTVSSRPSSFSHIGRVAQVDYSTVSQSLTGSTSSGLPPTSNSFLDQPASQRYHNVPITPRPTQAYPTLHRNPYPPTFPGRINFSAFPSPLTQPTLSSSFHATPPAQTANKASEKEGLGEEGSAAKKPKPKIKLITGNKKEKKTMAGKKSANRLLRDEGLQRTDNNMKQTSWPEIQMINQKNYYTEYMKRDDQILPLRLQTEANRDKMIRNAKDKDRALARTGNTDVPAPTNGEGEIEDEDVSETDGLDPTKIIVIHPGSQNLRIGFASDALPKTIPMCLAAKWPFSESEEYEARPKRQNPDGSPEELFGEEFSKKFTKMSNDLKVDMRANKRKVLPNSKELVINYNRRHTPEKIPEHNDPMRIEWTDVSKDDPKDKTTFFYGVEAQRVPDDSTPKYKLFWPMQHGWLNEKDYPSKEHLFDDFEGLIEQVLRKELGLGSGEWDQYSCVFIIPDLYDKPYVERALDELLTSIEFKQVAFVQESLAATLGAGFNSMCVVDMGAQKTSICCVDDGMCIEDSRINLKFGGYDCTMTLIKMMLHNYFPYQDINLMRRYDFLLAEELKINFCTMTQSEISVALCDFHLRAPNQPTRKYQFKTYDEVLLAAMGYFDPTIFDNSDKLKGRRKHIDRSYNAYDVDMPDDPSSAAQLAILTSIKPSLATTATGYPINGNTNHDLATPSKEKLNPLNFLSRMDTENGTSRVTSAAASPAPEGSNTPVPSGPFVFGANGTNGGSPGPGGTGNALQFGNGSHNSGTPVPPAGMFVDPLARSQKEMAAERDAVLPVAPLDTAIITSITHAAKGDEKKLREFFGNIMFVGGGAKTPGLGSTLEAKLKSKRPDLGDKAIVVGINPRDMDGQLVTWKGGAVFGNLHTHESWIGKLEYERLGSRVLWHRVLWNY